MRSFLMTLWDAAERGTNDDVDSLFDQYDDVLIEDGDAPTT